MEMNHHPPFLRRRARCSVAAAGVGYDVFAVVYAGFCYFSILYPVCLLNVFLVLGVRVRVRIRATEPPTPFPIQS